MAQEDWAGLAAKGKDLAGLRASTDALGLAVVDQLWILDSITSLALKSTADYSFDKFLPKGSA